MRLPILTLLSLVPLGPRALVGGLQALPRASAGDLEAAERLAAFLKRHGAAYPARAWLERAARLGLVRAQFERYRQLVEEEGVAPDAREALAWLEQAAAQEHGPALHRLALVLEEHRPHAYPDHAITAMLERGARAGERLACHELGHRALFGKRRDRNIAEARTWFLEAAACDFGPSLFYLGRMAWLGQDRAADPELAAYWFRRAIERDSLEARYYLGCLLERGEGVARDAASARWLMADAAEAEHLTAQLHLGLKALRGSDGVPDLEEARRWLLRAQKNLPTLPAVGAAPTTALVGAAWGCFQAAERLWDEAESVADLEAGTAQLFDAAALGWAALVIMEAGPRTGLPRSVRHRPA